MLHAIPTDELQDNDFWRFIFCCCFFFRQKRWRLRCACSVAGAGRGMKGRGCVDDKVLWCVMCGWQMCVYRKQVRGVHATVTSSARCIHVVGNCMSGHLVCVCVCVAWPWSCRFMHGSTKRHTLFFLSRTLACAYILVPCYISLAPCRVSRGDLRQSSVHMCRGVWCSVFFSARYSIETSLKEKY